MAKASSGAGWEFQQELCWGCSFFTRALDLGDVKIPDTFSLGYRLHSFYMTQCWEDADFVQEWMQVPESYVGGLGVA